MFSYESFVHNGANLELTYKFNSNYITIVSTPMFHVLGFNDTVLPVLMSGGTLILQRYFNGEELNDMIAQYHPTFIIMIPTMYYSTLRASNFNPENFRAMDYIIQGGSQPLPSIQAAFKQYGINIINGYGLTEAPLVLVNTPENSKRKPMSIGKAVMFVDARILMITVRKYLLVRLANLQLRLKMSRQDIGINQQRLPKHFMVDIY